MFLLKLNLGAAYFKITRSQALSRTKWRLSQRCPGQSGDYLSTVQEKVEIISALSRTKWRFSQHCPGQSGDYLSTVQDNVEIISALSRTKWRFSQRCPEQSVYSSWKCKKRREEKSVDYLLRKKQLPLNPGEYPMFSTNNKQSVEGTKREIETVSPFLQFFLSLLGRF